jgi:hypothetical protein
MKLLKHLFFLYFINLISRHAQEAAVMWGKVIDKGMPIPGQP